MTDRESILHAVDVQLRVATLRYLDEVACLAAARAGKAEWDRHNPDPPIGILPGNPYTPNPDGSERARVEYERWLGTKEYAIKVLLSLEKDDA